MKPFLCLPFKQSRLIGGYTLSEGYVYSQKAETLIHQQKLHAAIDYEVAYGTEVYSPLSGYAMASYNIQRAKDEQGQQIYHKKKPVTYGLGYCIQLYDPLHDLYMVFGHLSYITRALPFQSPLANDKGELFCKGRNLSQEHKKNISKLHWVVPIAKGDYLGDVGLSGLHLSETLPKRISKPIDKIPLRSYNYGNPHLHRNTFLRNADGSKGDCIDIYDIRDSYEHYPDPTRKGLLMGDNHLMLCDNVGLPIYCDE